MPVLRVIQLGKPTIEDTVAEGTSYKDAFAALGLPEPGNGTLLVNGATPKAPGDAICRDTTVHFNAAVKGA